MLAPGTLFSYPYSQYPPIDGSPDGIVFKLGRGGNSIEIMQLESSWILDLGHITYDVSELNDDNGTSPSLNEGYII
jgi:hypothetical protein